MPILIPVDTSRLKILVASPQVREAAQYDGEARVGQARNEQGVPLWSADLLFVTGEGMETARVKFPAPVAPDLGLPMSEVKVQGLVARHLRDKVYFSADAVSAASGRQQG